MDKETDSRVRSEVECLLGGGSSSEDDQWSVFTGRAWSAGDGRKRVWRARKIGVVH